MRYERHPITGCRVGSFVSADVLWMIDPLTLQQIVDECKMLMADPQFWQRAKDRDEEEKKDPPYKMEEGGVAVMPINGVITKYGTSFGGSSTLQLQKNLRTALKDDDVKSIMLHVDSPGGVSDGIPELAEAIKQADDKKPVFAYGDGRLTSAAYYLASGARRIFASRSAQIGSIGTAAQLRDYSKVFERDGIKVIPLVTGEFKMVGMPGTEITQVQIDDVMRRVNSVNAPFVADVAKHRNVSEQHVHDLKARVYVGAESIHHKLIDEISTYDQALKYAREYKPNDPPIPGGDKGTPVDDKYKAGATAIRGPAVPAITQAALENRSTGMTPAQIALVREKFPEAAQKANVDLDQWLLDMAIDQKAALATAQKPIDAELLKERSIFVRKDVEQLERDGLVTKAQKDQLMTLMTDAKLSPVLLQRDGEGYVAQKMLDIFRNNTAKVVTKQQSGDKPQPEQRQVPGGDDDQPTIQQASDKVIGNIYGNYKNQLKKVDAARTAAVARS